VSLELELELLPQVMGVVVAAVQLAANQHVALEAAEMLPQVMGAVLPEMQCLAVMLLAVWIAAAG